MTKPVSLRSGAVQWAAGASLIASATSAASIGIACVHGSDVAAICRSKALAWLGAGTQLIAVVALGFACAAACSAVEEEPTAYTQVRVWRERQAELTCNKPELIAFPVAALVSLTAAMFALAVRCGHDVSGLARFCVPADHDPARVHSRRRKLAAMCLMLAVVSAGWSQRLSVLLSSPAERWRPAPFPPPSPPPRPPLPLTRQAQPASAAAAAAGRVYHQNEQCLRYCARGMVVRAIIPCAYCGPAGACCAGSHDGSCPEDMGDMGGIRAGGPSSWLCARLTRSPAQPPATPPPPSPPEPPAQPPHSPGWEPPFRVEEGSPCKVCAKSFGGSIVSEGGALPPSVSASRAAGHRPLRRLVGLPLQGARCRLAPPRGLELRQRALLRQWLQPHVWGTPADAATRHSA